MRSITALVSKNVGIEGIPSFKLLEAMASLLLERGIDERVTTLDLES